MTIKDKNGMTWNANDVDNIHDRLHELLKDKAKIDPLIVQCPFCTLRFDREKQKIAVIDIGRHESFVFIIEIEKKYYKHGAGKGTEEVVSGLVSDCRGVDTVFATSEGIGLAAVDLIRHHCKLRNIKMSPTTIDWKRIEWMLKEQ